MDPAEQVAKSWVRNCPSSVTLRPCVDECKGNGLFAVKVVAPGDILFNETPIPGTAALLFDEPGKKHHCAHCTLSLNSKQRDGILATACPRGCGEEYCSEHCQDEAWRVHHEVLCSESTDRWRQFLEHAQSCSNEYYIVAARMFTSLRSIPGSSEECAKETEATIWEKLPWASYHAPAWWTTMKRPIYDSDGEDSGSCADDSKSEEAAGDSSKPPSGEAGSDAASSSTSLDEFFQDQVYEQTSETVDMLRQIFADAGLAETAACAWLTAESFGRLVGCLRVNALSVRAAAVLSEAQNDLRVANDHNILKGMAMYPMQSTLNHSSVPNCYMVSDPEEPHRCIIYARDDVAPGEELCIDYLAGATHSAEECVQILRSQYGIQRLCLPEVLEPADCHYSVLPG